MGNRYKFTVDLSAKHEEVTGSCILISVHHPDGEIKFLVDCGQYLGEANSEAKNYTDFDFNPGNIDFVLLTHNHTDHNGRIPLLYKNGYYRKVYTTKDTSILLPWALGDNEKIIRLNAKKSRKKALYDDNNVKHALTNVVPCVFRETFSPMRDVKVTFFKNGHLVGAAMILVQISCSNHDDINILFTGDYKKENIFFDVPELPKWVTELPLYVVCESTYGNTDSTETAKPVLIDDIAKWFKEGKNTALILALSQGRFQETNYKLKMAQGKQLDDDIRIYGDGNMAIKYSNLYRDAMDIHSHMRDFLPCNHTYVENGLREEVINSPHKKIIVTTSGMGSYGPAQEYIPKLIERKDVGIYFTCYLCNGTTGHQLVNSDGDVLVRSVMKKKIAEVRVTSEMSCHAKRDELVEFLSKFDNIQGLFINHGEIPVKVGFAKYCKERLDNCKEVAILGMGYTIRVDEWKIVKSIRERLF